MAEGEGGDVTVMFGRLTCVQAALVAVGAAQTEAAVAGVTGLGEGRGGVDGVPPPPKHVGGIQELGVGDGLQTEKSAFEKATVPFHCLDVFNSENLKEINSGCAKNGLLTFCRIAKINGKCII